MVKSTGDGILAIFAEPGQAVGCAFELMDALREIDVEIRAGIHTGEIEDRGRHIGGIAVHIAARAQALAGSGAVFVTRTVRDLMTGSGFAFKDEGMREPKGIPEPWQLFEVSRET